jgi:hypothetical protein
MNNKLSNFSFCSDLTSGAIKMTISTLVYYYCVYCHFYCIRRWYKIIKDEKSNDVDGMKNNFENV